MSSDKTVKQTNTVTGTLINTKLEVLKNLYGELMVFNDKDSLLTKSPD